jgi:DNA segregation ATPase FtsK/SpoIIIE-like protein
MNDFFDASEGDVDDSLMEAAMRYVQELKFEQGPIVLMPISRLQRKFHIGYGLACRLSSMLVINEVWSIRHDNDGLRIAVIATRAD